PHPECPRLSATQSPIQRAEECRETASPPAPSERLPRAAGLRPRPLPARAARAIELWPGSRSEPAIGIEVRPRSLRSIPKVSLRRSLAAPHFQDSARVLGIDFLENAVFQAEPVQRPMVVEEVVSVEVLILGFEDTERRSIHLRLVPHVRAVQEAVLIFC